MAEPISDDDIIRVLAEADHAKSTSELAEMLGIPRSTLWGKLQAMPDGVVETWNPQHNIRMWDTAGDFGSIRISDVYNAEPLIEFLETGAFPAETEYESVVTMIEEALVEVNWQCSASDALAYDDAVKLAALLNMPVSEFSELSPNEVYSRIHDGCIDEIPRS